MTFELPVLRLALAGFSIEQQRAVGDALRGLGEATVWELATLDSADAWWLNGARVQILDRERIRVASGTPSGHALQLHLPDVDRPVGFAQPLPLRFKPLYSFDATSSASMNAVLHKFEAWLAPVTAQFCLAAHIVEHQSALGSGVFELRLNGDLLAVVDMQGEVAVRGTAGPADFEGAVWRRQTVPMEIPEQFVHTSLSQLMWQYAMRTQRDALPSHYRTGLIYFRRAPRVTQRLLKDSHLLLMRQLSVAPAAFRELQRLCGQDEVHLARDLASLYFVGSITSNPKRAARPPAQAESADQRTPRTGDEADSNPGPTTNLPFGNSDLPLDAMRRPAPPEDMTAPAPLTPTPPHQARR